MSIETPPRRVETLETSLLRLHDLCDPPRAATVGDLQRRWAQGVVRILLVGEAKRGKSTLGNAFLGREVLPTGVTPVTAVATVVTAGDPERAEVRFRTGASDQVPLSSLGDYVTERGNPGNGKGVEQVTLTVASGLPVGMSLVDTPGVGSVYEHNTHQARAALEQMDLAVLVLTADPPMSASEADLLAEVGRRAVATFVVLNKADRLSEPELAEALEFLREVAPGVDVLPCSARAGLAARLAGEDTAYRASGVAAVRDALLERVSTRGLEDLSTSIAVSAHRVAVMRSDETALGLAALEAQVDARQDQVVAFRRHLATLPDIAADARARVSWRLRQLRRGLTDDATTRCADLIRQARAEVDRVLAHADPGHPDQARADGELLLANSVRTGVDDWCDAWTSRLRDELDHIVRDAEDDLARAGRGVRDAAIRDLGVDLHLPRISLDPLPETRLHYDFSEPVGWEAPLAEQVRRHAPGPLARRRTELALRRRASELPDRHIGRARHGLDEILRAAERSLPAQLTQAFQDLGEGLRGALDAATAASARTTRDVDIERSRLTSRLQQLAALVDDLSRTGVPT